MSQSSKAAAALMLRRAALACPGVAWVLRSLATEPAQHVPDGVAVQQLLLVVAGTARDDLGGPVFQPDHLLIAWRQRADGDQDGPQVIGCLPGG